MLRADRVDRLKRPDSRWTWLRPICGTWPLMCTLLARRLQG